MAQSANGGPQGGSSVTWNADEAQLAEALEMTDRALRRLVKAIKEGEDTDRAFKIARRQLRANLELREDEAQTTT